MTVLSSAAEVTPEFLTSALQAHFPGASVLSCWCESMTDVAGVASAMVRVHLHGDCSELPTTVILKIPPAHPVTRAQLKAMGFFEREVGFYRTLSEQTAVHTPRCYSTGFDPETGAAFLLLEDLASARNGNTVKGGTVEEVAAVLLALARLHAHWWQDTMLDTLPWLGLRSMLAPSAVVEVFERSWPSFVRKLSIPVDDEIMAMKAWISSSLADAYTSLFDHGPRTLIHDDIQGDNLFFTDDPDRAVVLIDWQLATCARGAVDVASAIRQGLEPEVRRSAEAMLLRGYHEALVEAGVSDYPMAQCRADYDLAAVVAPARLASAVGLHTGLIAHQGAAWDTLFPRLAPR